MLYDLAIVIYDFIVHLAAPFSRKPRKMMKGHWVVYELLRQQVEKGEQYKAVIYADGENADWKSNPTDYRITEQTVTSENTLNIRMAAGDGQAISFMAL